MSYPFNGEHMGCHRFRFMGFIRYDQLTFNNMHDRKIKFMDIRPAI